MIAFQQHAKTPAFLRFRKQLYHACLARIFEPLRQFMEKPDIIMCPDGHFRRAIYSIGPFIADYPEQVWLTGIVQNWCPKYGSITLLLLLIDVMILFRCYALPSEFDREGPLRTQDHRECLLDIFTSDQLWESFGINDEVVVSLFYYLYVRSISDYIEAAIHRPLSAGRHS
jgi:hypothetical protein